MQWIWKWDRRQTDFVPRGQNFADITGLVFGKYTVLYPIGPKGPGPKAPIAWKVRCVCGKEYKASGQLIRASKSNPCNCYGSRWPWKWDRDKTDFMPKKGSRFKDITGMRSGKLACLYPVGRGKDNQVLWKCSCDCGGRSIVIGSLIQKGRKNDCGCSHKGITHFRWTGFGEIPGKYLNSIRNSAKERGHTYNISDTYLWNLFLEQKRRCALSGLNIGFISEEGLVDVTASLDRINNRKGYIEGNVHWVHKDVNLMKSNYTLKRFLTLCDAVCSRAASR